MQRVIRIPFQMLLCAAPLHGSLPSPSAAPEISSASLLLLLLAARTGEDHVFKSKPVECFYSLYV